MKQFRWVIISVLLIVISSMMPLAFTGTVQAGAEKSGLEELTNGADSVIVGTVVEYSSYWNDEHTRIYTSVVLSVEEWLKGTASQDRITVSLPGGEVDGVGEWVSDMPSFDQGERAVVFLKKLLEAQLPKVKDSKLQLSEEQFEVYGGFRGKFTITGDKVGNLPVAEFKERVGKVVRGQVLSAEELVLPSSSVTFPYSYSGLFWPHPPAPVVSYRINENTADCTGEGAAVQAAAATWSNAGANFSFSYAGATGATAVTQNFVNEILWTNLGSGGTLALTTTWYYTSNNNIFECDMEFNEYYTWSTSGQYDVQTVALHEFGHFLFLDHSSDINAVMYYQYQGIRRALYADDIAGIRYIYGSSLTAPTVTNSTGASNIASTSARLNGEITSTGGENPTVHIYWGTSDGGTTPGSWAHDENLGVKGAGTFYTDISSLTASTTYYYRCYATNAAGSDWADATASFTTGSAPNNPPNAPASPLCEGVTNPSGVTDPTPEFSWTFSDPDGGDTQGAYQLLVASTSENLASGIGDMWDSGKVNSSASEVSYADADLSWNQTYYWKVKNWDNHDAEGVYCSQQQFTMSAAPAEVWVDDDFNAATPGWGYDHFALIQDGIDAVAGSTVNVAAGTYYENITLIDGVQVLGEGADVTTIDGGGSGSVVTASSVGATTVLDGFTITNGSATNGGGMSNTSSSPVVSNCIFSANSANHGGGMYNFVDSSPVVTNCTFSGNSADSGGGVNNEGSSATVTNCTFSGNSASQGGGMYNWNNSSPVMTNCIFWGNGEEIYNDETSTPVVSYCDVEGEYTGDGNIDADPLFVDAGTGDYHLQAGSPCIDVGNNSAPSIPATDFEGNPRVLDGNGDLVAVVDMGVDEHGASSNNAPDAPTSPLCEGETNPTNVTDTTPEFSWTFSDPDGGDSQGAYQILVASSSGNLTADNGDMWDSGKVSGSDIEVSYDGAAFSWYQTCYWKVKTWDNYDAEGSYCGEQQFTTGIISYGLLRVETSPAVPATISANGVPRNAWGLDWVKMPPGEYTLSFTDTPGYLVPETIEVTYYPGGGPTTQPLSEPIEILPDTTTEVIVHFIQLGNLWVRTDPMVSTIISLDGTPPANNWGFWVDLLPGDYDLSLSDVVGYATPLEVEVTYPGESPVIQAITDPITVEPGGTTAVVVHFIQLGNLQVSTSPMLPATIFVDGNPMNEWGFWLYLEAGDYTVSFEDMDGYITPSPEVVTVTAGVTTYVTGDYVSE